MRLLFGHCITKRNKLTHLFSSNLSCCIFFVYKSHEPRIEELAIKNQEVKAELLNEIKRRFKTSILKTMAEFSVEIKSYEGINAIKKILQGGV